jgi:5,10-methylenetetrahydromethanopterin reductase
MQYGVGLFPETIEGAIQFAQYLDESTYEKMWMTDSHQLYADAYVTLGQCAAATEDLQLSTGVTNPITRHPTVTANAISSVNEIAGGRATLAIGTGDSAVYSIGKTPARVSELKESVETMQALLAGDTVEFDGESFQLEAPTPADAVHIAAEGPKTLRMTGAVADGVVFGGGTEPETVDWARERIAEGCADAGRSLSDLELTVLAPACVAETKEAAVEELMDVLEPIAYHNFSVSTESAPEHLRDELQELVDRHDMQEHGQADASPARALSEETMHYLGDRFAIAGPPEYCTNRLAALNSRADAVYFGFPTRDVPEHTRRFETQVLEADTT